MTCKVCGSVKYNKIGEVKGIWKENKNAYQCEECFLYYIDSPSEEEMYSLYKNEYHKSIKNKIFEIAKRKMRYARVLNQFNFIKNAVDCENKKVCEIGAFDGLLLNIFKNNNSEVFGYEISDQAREYAENKYDIALKTDFLSDNQKYDIIVLSHVIEHFKEPKETLSKIKSMLNENGFIYIEVPNSPMPNQCSKEMLIRYLTTTHTVNFNMDNLKTFVENGGFKIIKYQYNNYKSDNEELKINLLEGRFPSLNNLNNLFNFSLFALKTIAFPKSVFVDYDDNNNIWTYGENIRILAGGGGKYLSLILILLYINYFENFKEF